MNWYSHPGRLGDVLWSLPTLRHLGGGGLVLPPDCAALVPLLRQQLYLHAVEVDPTWQVQDTAPRTPASPPKGANLWHDAQSLGYREWPQKALPFEVAAAYGIAAEELDLSPWITFPGRLFLTDVEILIAWSDYWFELKVGVTDLILDARAYRDRWSWRITCKAESRWRREYRPLTFETNNFQQLAEAISCARVLLTDCSAAHVLAAALGKSVVVMEPEPMRHHLIFWPGSQQRVVYALGDAGQQVELSRRWEPADNVLGQRIFPVLGNDGKPTFDSRATIAKLEEVLGG
jgi:hypothetical protein